MGIVFKPCECIDESVKATMNKRKIIRWYHSMHKDIIPYKKFNKKQYTIFNNRYISMDKYNAENSIKDRIKFNSLDGTAPVTITGFEYKGYLHFVVEKYSAGFMVVSGVPLPKFEHRYVGVSTIGKKYEEFYMSQMSLYKFGLEGDIKISRFLDTQYNEMERSMG